MSRFSRQVQETSNTSLRCAFCHKAQDVVGKLISNPSDYPRAYICDECIAVCSQIVLDDNSAYSDALLAEFLSAAEEWLTREDEGQDASEQLSQMRDIARKIFAESSKA